MAETDKFLVTNIRQYLDSDNPRLGEEKLIQELSECYISCIFIEQHGISWILISRNCYT